MDTGAICRSSEWLVRRVITRFSTLSALLIGITITIAGCGSGAETGCRAGDLTPSFKAQAPERGIITGVSHVFPIRRDGSGRPVAVGVGEPVRVDELEFAVMLIYRLETQASSSPISLIMNWFVSTAQACSPVHPTEFVSRVVGADLTSSAALGSGYPAGASLAQAFLIRSDDESRFAGTDSVAPPFQLLSEFGSPEPVQASYSYVLRFNAAAQIRPDPAAAQSHRFTFSITLDNGDTFSEQSDPVQVLPSAG